MVLRLHFFRETALLGTGLALIGLAVYFDRNVRLPVTVATLRNPAAFSRNPLDILGYDVTDVRAANMADIGLYGGPTLPLLLSLHPRPRPDYPVILVMWLETMLLTFALASVIKNRTSRPRPYVLNDTFPFDQQLNRNDRAAFLSGHAALATAGSVLFARLVNHYSTNLAGYFIVWFLAGAFPGFTGFLRVKAAKHWPTDVVAGILVGGGVSTLIFRLHTTAATKA